MKKSLGNPAVDQQFALAIKFMTEYIVLVFINVVTVLIAIFISKHVEISKIIFFKYSFQFASFLNKILPLIKILSSPLR